MKTSHKLLILSIIFILIFTCGCDYEIRKKSTSIQQEIKPKVKIEPREKIAPYGSYTVENLPPNFSRKTGTIKWTNLYGEDINLREEYGVDLEKGKAILHHRHSKLPSSIDWYYSSGLIQTGGVMVVVGNDYEDYVRIDKEDCDRIQKEIGTKKLSNPHKNLYNKVYCVYTSEGNFAKFLIKTHSDVNKAETEHLNFIIEYTLWEKD